ncbi:MAG TPA: hypothetical protein VFP79_09085 [Pseudolabrys sp.]|jgi:hypothetical protein|nr:hypothetical protein [Pseudolabrys sp.]
MDVHQLARLPLPVGYVFENGTPFYDKLGEERAAALLKALSTSGYFIVSEGDMLARSGGDGVGNRL